MATAKQIDFSQLLTAQEAAAQLDLAISTVQSMVSRNSIETIETRLGKLIHVDTVKKYLEERRGKVGPKKKLQDSA